MTYSYILPFARAIQEINENPRLLPNITLGYNLYENYFNVWTTSEAVADLLSPGQQNIPNYSCGRQTHPLAILEGSESDISIHISAMSSIYKIPQVSYGFVSSLLNDKTQFPYFYRMLPKEETKYPGVVKLLLHFRWTWIGLIAPDTDDGERFRRTLTTLFTGSGVCLENKAFASWHAFLLSSQCFTEMLTMLGGGKPQLFLLGIGPAPMSDVRSKGAGSMQRMGPISPAELPFPS
ncbi:vomeronasal type-2 receptor 26-like [Hemicordylus capensis]|uniref:vomeronasal type-2 receptor 26-like n=1 Tax=Hemicordylus capensis TaxID=884348 RepID=UPI002304B62A|nr:vomeronasal type-2 receptor 26-like [Hemicordylus capensis]